MVFKYRNRLSASKTNVNRKVLMDPKNFSALTADIEIIPVT